MERVEYGTDGYPYKLSMSTGIENTEQYPIVQAIQKADYEKRLKADMVAMLEEIQLKITEKSYYDLELVELDDVNDIIQQKINEYKGESEGT